MSDPVRLATFAVPLSGNKGSASMTLGLIDAFEEAGIPAEFAIFSYYPKRDGIIAESLNKPVSVHPGHPKHLAFQLLPMIVLNKIAPFLVPRKWKDHIRALQEADLVLLVGGTTFADSMLFKVPWNVLAALPGYMLGRPTVFLSQTIGPTQRRLNRSSARWTLKRAIDVHGRGRQSEAYVKKIGIEHARYFPDLSFTMAVPDFGLVVRQYPILQAAQEIIAADERKLVGVAPNSIVRAKAAKRGIDYVDFVTSVIGEILAQGMTPILIPHSYREDAAKEHNNDRSLCASVLERLGSRREQTLYVDADLPSPALRSLIGRLHLLVASRFHSMVSALAMGVPPITYGWGGHKYSEVLDEFGLTEELYLSYDKIIEDDFGRKLAAISARRDELAAQIRTGLETVQKEARQLPGHLVALTGR